MIMAKDREIAPELQGDSGIRRAPSHPDSETSSTQSGPRDDRGLILTLLIHLCYACVQARSR